MTNANGDEEWTRFYNDLLFREREGERGREGEIAGMVPTAGRTIT